MSSSSPTVLDFVLDDDEDRIIIGAEQDDVSLVLESPREIDVDELRSILEDLPDSIATVDELVSRRDPQ